MQVQSQNMNENAFFKTFVFEQQTTQATVIIKCQLALNQFISVKPALKLLLLQLDKCFFRIYNFNKNCYQSLQQVSENCNAQKYVVPLYMIQGQIVLIKYIQVVKSQIEYKDDISQSQSVKKERSKQRTIFEVLAIVKRWREIYLKQEGKVSNIHPGRKINLQQAAAIIGISKKSLDDYYYQLRLGQKYGFDFKNKLDDKFGVLRAFIKSNRPKGRRMDKNQKHPKRLRILDEFFDNQIMPSQSIISSNQKNSNKLKDSTDKNKTTIIPNNYYQDNTQLRNNFDNFIFDQSQALNPFNPFKNQIRKSIQDQFYNQFEFMLNQPHDPFLALGNNYNEDMIDINNSLFIKKDSIKVEKVFNMETEQKTEKILVNYLNQFILNENQQNNEFFQMIQ